MPIFEVITTHIYTSPTRIVTDPVVTDFWIEERLKTLPTTDNRLWIKKFYSQMDTINYGINRQLSHLSVYRLYQNAYIWENAIEDAQLNYKYDSFQSIPNIEELRYYTVKSEHHAFNQLKEILSVFERVDFAEWEFKLTEWEFRRIARQYERRTLLLLIDNLDALNIDMLNEFLKNSSNELRRDYNWLCKDNEFYNVTHDKKPQYKYRYSEVKLRNRLYRANSIPTTRISHTNSIYTTNNVFNNRVSLLNLRNF